MNRFIKELADGNAKKLVSKSFQERKRKLA
jgi:hypothetical protein